MLFNYIKLAIRLLLRNPFFSAVNVLGLAVGFASFFGLWNYASTELKSDRYHNNHERIAQIVTDWSWTDDNVNWGRMDIPASMTSALPRLKNDFHPVEDFVRIRPLVGLLALPDADQVHKEMDMIYADRTLFDFFTIPLIYGSASDVLARPNTIVLSNNASRKFFGDKNPVGQTLVLNGTTALNVTGVFENLPSNTHLKFDFVLSNEQSLEEWNSLKTSWSEVGWSLNYLRLRDTDLKGFENVLNTKIDSYWSELVATMPRVKAKVKLLPLADAAFAEHNNPFQPYLKSKATLRFIAGIAIAVLLMSWINYINLTISRTTRRVTEVATRKISGAASADLIKQFVTESVITMLIAVALAVTFLQLVRDPLDVVLQVKIQRWYEFDPQVLLFFGSVILLGMLITGLYPAAVSYRTSATKLFSSGKNKATMLPSFLTTTQYVIAIVSTFLVIIIHQQLNFIYDKELGFDKKNVYFVSPALRKSANHPQELRTFMDQVSRLPGIKSAMITSQFLNLPISSGNASGKIYLDGLVTEENFVRFFKHKLIAGRDFVKDDRNDVVILSQHAVERLGYNVANAVGRRVFVGESGEEKEIIGIIENFRVNSFMRTENTEANTGRGMVLMYKNGNESPADVLILKVENNQVLTEVENMYKESFPENVFSGFYFEDVLFNAYSGEKTLKSQLTFFTILIIGIACFGLLGMVANKVVEKTREIGIRKVLGAGAGNIVHVLLNSTMYQITVATVVGLILSYFLSENYLERYLERISLSPIHFTLPVICIFLVLLISIAGVLYRVIRTNPVDSIRHN